ncbi:MAG: DUF5107 domain-containing protein [Saprospiraceae bacterium]
MLKYFVLLVLSLPFSLSAQEKPAVVTEAPRVLKTYPFSDPDPLPILTTNPKIYPYHRFDGYSLEGKPQAWKTVKLENDYVEVYVLPEVGGKIWGALEKASGEEFIYRNEVIKFRNIAMRGPWTSGGIEFNFGIIGHHPGAATPVDYIIQTEEDGSVSCVVGNIDLPSRTQWRVKIRLPKDKAYFETAATWYNPTPLQQAYYNWMTAAAAARPDLEFFTPGNQYLEHSGKPMPWPYDQQGHHLPAYKENNFGPSKSYHVVGQEHDFFGGYFHDTQFGFGHWAAYEEMPGQKLWLWALSRSGGIWEDLLTDTDGQYIEFQAGRLFVQYSPGGDDNPVTQANFPPYTTDHWTEKWFPVKSIGGLSDVSPEAVLHLSSETDNLKIGINALARTEGTLVVKAGGKIIHREKLTLEPMGVFSTNIALNGAPLEAVSIKEMDLHLSTTPDTLGLKRPFLSPNIAGAAQKSAEKLYREGMEDMKFRLFSAAIDKFEACLALEPQHLPALCQLAEGYYRNGEYDQALAYANRALQWDTYHPQANFMAGVIYRALGDWVNAKESLGWAARSMALRTAAYGQMAEIYLLEADFKRAKVYADKALDFNRYNVNALQVLAILARKTGQVEAAKTTLNQLLSIDPLNHFAYFEQYLLAKSPATKTSFLERHRSEFRDQTFMELAIDYYNKGQHQEALEVFELAPNTPLIQLWQAYLQGNDDLAAIASLPVDFVFPFRRETIKVLEWANAKYDHWTLKYYLALNYWGKDRLAEAATLLKECQQTPDNATFYLTRADLLQKTETKDAWQDLQKALELAPDNWRAQRAKTAYLQSHKEPAQAMAYAQKVYQQFPGNNAIGMDYARALIAAEQYDASIKILKAQNVLPFEGASEGRRLYEQAHIGAALEKMQKQQYKPAVALLLDAKEWPENLGVGKPYDPEERISDYLLAICYDKLGAKDKSLALHQAIINHTNAKIKEKSPYHIFGILSQMQITPTIPKTKLLENLGANSPESQWIRASIMQDKAALDQLGRQHPALWVRIEMRFLTQILAWVK